MPRLPHAQAHARDHGLRRASHLTRWIVAGSVLLSGAFTYVVAAARPGGAKSSQRVAPVAARPDTEGSDAPVVAVPTSPTTDAEPAPAAAPAPTLQPAPAPAQVQTPAPDFSGGGGGGNGGTIVSGQS